MTAARKSHRGERVLVLLSPNGAIWHEAVYLGQWTFDINRRPWHQVRINAGKQVVPMNRIRSVPR